MGDTTSAKVAIAASVDATLAAQQAEADAEAAQLGLFAEPLTGLGQAKALAKGSAAKRGPGRPPGALNRRTEATVKFLLSRHRDPREVLLEIAEANVYDLAALLGCKPHEALTEKRLAAIGVLPYVAARITPEVVNDNRQVLYLNIIDGAAQLGAADPGGGVAVTVLDHLDYVEVAEEASAITGANGGSNTGDPAMLPAPSHNQSHE